MFATDYGFIPKSVADANPSCVLIAASFPGCGIVAKPVTMLELHDQGEPEPKLVGGPCEDLNWQEVYDLDDLPDPLTEQIGHFFLAYERRAGHEVELGDWHRPEAGRRVIEEAQERWRDEQ